MVAQIRDFMEYVRSQPEHVQKQLLSRKAPLEQRVTFVVLGLVGRFSRFWRDGGNRPSAGGASTFALKEPMAA
jgi:hypothetical protein